MKLAVLIACLLIVGIFLSGCFEITPVCGNGECEDSEDSINCSVDCLKASDEKTCVELGGFICQEDETCSDTWLDSIEERCCPLTCEPLTSLRIFVAIDSEAYNQLKNEIIQFVEDVESDTGSIVVLKTYNEGVFENSIKEDIKSVYENYELKGLIFIGNIPFKKVVQSPTGDYPSDVYYRDLYNKCDYDSSGNIVSNSLWNKCFFGLAELNPLCPEMKE